MKYNKTVFQALVMVTQFSINMLVPILLCSFLGIVIDKQLNTSYWVVILFFAGALAGFRNVYRFAKKIFSTKSESLYERSKRNRDGCKKDAEKDKKD